jgi:uncharacterized protein YbjT (DUF2867 family)
VSAPKLVIGANGFLGSHVTRQLIAAGADVRAMVRPTANTRSIDDLDVTRFHGDVFDTATVREAMEGCDGPGSKTRHRCSTRTSKVCAVSWMWLWQNRFRPR